MAEIPSDFFTKLQTIYQRDPNLRAFWRAEEAALREILPLVADRLAFNYQIGHPLGVGGSGIVAIAVDQNLQTKRALKIARPSPGKEVLLAKILRSETESLLRLSHQNLMRIYAQGVIERDEQLIPFYVMDFVEGAVDADDYLAKHGVTPNQVLAVFLGALSAVEYLHGQETIHMDLKPENILVTPSCVPVISDLGFAKHLRVDDQYTLIGGTEGYIHPDARDLVTQAKTDPNRLRGESPRTALRREWDLFSLGKTFLKLLTVLDTQNPRALSPYQRRYLRLLACRLLDGRNTDEELAVGLSKSVFEEVKYRAASAARADLEKLSGSYNLEARIEELNFHIQDTIQASTLATTPFSKRVKHLVEHPLVARLGKVTQLGLLNLVYPTATHSRLEHSIGTFSVLCRYLVALYNDALNPLFRQIMNEEDLRAALLAGVLHDLGQYPLAHDVEEADPAMPRHETIGNALLSSHSGLRELIEKEWAVPIERVLEVLNADPASLKGDLKARILHSLIDGPIDADKLDYLIRDSRRLGLTYGGIIDLERLLRCLTVVFRKQDENTFAALGIHEKGKVSAEAIAFARYAMFGQVYWHHAYRAFKIMFHRLVWEALRKRPRQLRTELRQFVSPDPLRPKGQRSLFGESELAGELEAVPINGGDLAVIGWFAERGGGIGMDLFRLVSRRSLFKRLLVLSRERMTDRALWDRLSEFGRTNLKNWQKKLALQEALQERVVALVERPLVPRPPSAVISDDARNQFLAHARQHAVVLIDIPPEPSAKAAPLEFLVEEDRRRYKIDEVPTESLEESIVWQGLRKNFRESIGKVRVFAHPDYREFLNAYLSRTEIENSVDGALRKVDAE